MSSEIVQQKICQFLIHSFLYYKLDESIISDEDYDYICQDLQKLLQQHSDSELPFQELIQSGLGTEASGFSIKTYPPEIISAALHLLYQSQYSNTLDFSEFVERLGYRLELYDK